MPTTDLAALIRKVLEEKGYDLVQAGPFVLRIGPATELYVERTVELANALIEHGIKL